MQCILEYGWATAQWSEPWQYWWAAQQTLWAIAYQSESTGSLPAPCQQSKPLDRCAARLRATLGASMIRQLRVPHLSGTIRRRISSSAAQHARQQQAAARQRRLVPKREESEATAMIDLKYHWV